MARKLHILVTGANGQLGREIRRRVLPDGPRYLFSDVSRLPGAETLYLDITDIDAVRLVCESEHVDVIVNCAAYTDVERAESDTAMADLLNHRAAANLALVAKERDAVLIHISTDYVFHGDRSEPYPEDWPTAPLGVYGATKLLGEKAVTESGCRYLIFRTAWLYSPYGKNFVKTMMRLTAERETLSVVYDQIGTPTAAADLAGLITGLVAERRFAPQGIYHYTDEGVCSWYDFACAIRDLAGNRCDIRPCRSSEYPTRAARPSYSVLDKGKVRRTFGVSIPHWYESLALCVDRIKTEKN